MGGLRRLLVERFAFGRRRHLLGRRISGVCRGKSCLLKRGMREFRNTPRCPVSINRESSGRGFGCFIEMRKFRARKLVATVHFGRFCGGLGTSGRASGDSLTAPIFCCLFRPPRLDKLAVVGGRRRFFDETVCFGLTANRCRGMGLTGAY